MARKKITGEAKNNPKAGLKGAAKFVLSIGDEGGILSHIQGGTVIRRLFAPTSNYADTRPFIEAIQADPKAPIYMLVDVMDQSYVQQSLPPVSSFSVNNLIKRKMDRDFAVDDLKGALLIGREKEGRRDWKYLFVTLSHSPQLKAWLDVVMEMPNHFKGIYLLPVEAEDFMHRLQAGVTGRAPKRGKAEEGEAKWQLLVAHNKVGGFRQVVLKGGKLIFARLAQPIGDSQPAVVAGSIEQEISVTLEYLKRLSYDDEQGMDVYVVTSEAIKSSIDPNNIHAGGVHILTPHEAAGKMNLLQATEPNDQFADVLMAVAFSTAKKHLLKLETKDNEKLNKLYSTLLAVKAGSVVATIGALGAIVYFGMAVPAARTQIETLERDAASAQQQLATAMELEKELPDDLEKITDLVGMHQQLNKLGLSPLTTLEQYRKTRESANVLMKEFTWQVSNTLLDQRSANDAAPDPNGGDASANANASAEKLAFSFVADMYETQDGTDAFNKKVDEYLKALAAAFPGYTVAVTSERPGIREEDRQVFGLGQEKNDPLLGKESFPLSFSVEGTGIVEAKPSEGSEGGGV